MWAGERGGTEAQASRELKYEAMPVVSVTTEGVPTAAASGTTLFWASMTDGQANRSAPARWRRTSGCGTWPVKTRWLATPAASARLSRNSR